MPFDFKRGEVLLIDKPKHWTSFDVVNKVKRTIKEKVGHAGTLDPLATGLLILCTGNMTKEISRYQNLGKEYEGEFRLGASTLTYDAENEPKDFLSVSHLTDGKIKEEVKKFLGEIEQTPPSFSAVYVDGDRAYKKVRRGEAVELKSRKVFVHAFEISSVQLPFVSFRVHCRKGTYVRSLVHDLGQALGVGAYVTALRRTAIGNFRVEDAWTLEKLLNEIHELKDNKELIVQ